MVITGITNNEGQGGPEGLEQRTMSDQLSLLSMLNTGALRAVARCIAGDHNSHEVVFLYRALLARITTNSAGVAAAG